MTECRPSMTRAEVEAIVNRESIPGKGVDAARHPMLNWWHCSTHRTWHPAPMPEDQGT